MRIAFGLKAHSGWAALVALGARGSELLVVDRRRLEIVRAGDAPWAKQPYHAAEDLPSAEARDVVRRGVEAARVGAVRELRAALKRADDAGHEVAACGVLVGAPMPEWSVDEIVAVHFRMHKAEGALFRNVLIDAAKSLELRVFEVPERSLGAMSERSAVASIGKAVGPPWGVDQKDAALAALIALRGGDR
ncbi:MAG TPA: hypothetical protein VFB67_10825 [Candidatus Polarisedimenticolaceae bacterium]|nr:hypothetical protein [Candidatus Polarisedimenticolaceae bacterium]